MSIRPLLQRQATVRSLIRRRLEIQGFLEVDTPIVSRELLPEVSIDPYSGYTRHRKQVSANQSRATHEAFTR